MQRNQDLLTRFLAKVEFTDTCWLWTGSKTKKGYGEQRVNKKKVRAHQVALALANHPYPEGLQPDHLCRVRHCVRPSHLEFVTAKENVLRGEGLTAKQARQTHCLHGHELSGKNLHTSSQGWRICRRCKAVRQLEYTARRKARLGI